MQSRLFAAIALAISMGGAAQAATLIHAGRVIDGVANQAMTERTIVVDGGRIVAIESGYRAQSADDRVVDLKGSTLMPGLMDMHVHITSEYSRTSELDRFKKDVFYVP